jgi:hypothetical protein
MGPELFGKHTAVESLLIEFRLDFFRAGLDRVASGFLIILVIAVHYRR